MYAGTIGFGYRACKDPCKGGDDMKRSLTLLLASLFLAFSLTAGGGNGKNNNGQNGNDQNNSTVTGDTAGNNAENGTNGTANNGNTANGGVNNGTTNNGNGGLVDDTGDVLEDIGNGTRDVLDDAGRALTGNNGAANRSAGSNIR